MLVSLIITKSVMTVNNVVFCHSFCSDYFLIKNTLFWSEPKLDALQNRTEPRLVHKHSLLSFLISILGQNF